MTFNTKSHFKPSLLEAMHRLHRTMAFLAFDLAVDVSLQHGWQAAWMGAGSVVIGAYIALCVVVLLETKRPQESQGIPSFPLAVGVKSLIVGYGFFHVCAPELTGLKFHA